LPRITDDHPQSRPRHQLCESAARAALLPTSYTTRGDTIRSCRPLSDDGFVRVQKNHPAAA
ncbi:MAG: hypothetical protein LW715_14590, partial [Rhodobacter sp.]|nr:hypothetical protein [Rhodobacter sp.]